MAITIYTKPGCPWCRGVLDFLNENKIEYEERDVTKSLTMMDEMVQKSHQTKTPTLDIDGVIISDTDKDEVEKYLKERGYYKK